MDINNKEELEKLRNFTFYISGDCPSDVLNCADIENCNENIGIEDCVMCWRKALTKEIEQLSLKS